MIIFEDVYKRYTAKKSGKWILQSVSLTIPAKTTVGIIGGSGAGKSTFLKLIGGIEPVTSGKIRRLGRVSWPMGFGGGLDNALTGRQNARFVCRIHGHTDDIEERLSDIQTFSELGGAFDNPIKRYTANMRLQYLFALYIACDFDVYISDMAVVTGANPDFRKKANAAFKELTENAGLLMTAPEIILKEFCSAGIWLHEGQAHWFDDINEALKQHKENTPV